MHPLLQKQDYLHNEGTALLETLLQPLLKSYGDVRVGGSYEYRLLNHPDLDIDVVHEDMNKEHYIELVSALLRLPEVSKLSAADRVNHPHTHAGERPFGYWLSPTITVNSVVWKLDIWLQKPEWFTGTTSRYATELATIDEATRITILTLKDELITQGRYGMGREFVSTDIYDGVLNGGVNSVEELKNYLSNRQL